MSSKKRDQSGPTTGVPAIEHNKCRFCGDGAAALVTLELGCMCYPDDRAQYLCLQHVMRANPLGQWAVLISFSDHVRFIDDDYRR
jgi:hypothetical protein